MLHGRRSNQMVDWISTLPDAILCHILSFLPTKHAVATSLLSKRWRYLWRSVPSLDFELFYTNEENECFRFKELVTSVLFLRDPLQPIQRFRLNYQGDDDDNNLSIVNEWVPYVLQHRVEKLHLRMSSVVIPIFPVANLRCATLVVLKLRDCVFDMKQVSSVALPSLKALDLEDVYFPANLDVFQLLSGFPILEELRWNNISVDDDSSLTLEEFESISLPKLIRADIIETWIHFPLKALCNVTSLRIEIDKVDRLYNDIPTFHNLTHMVLLFECYDFSLIAEVLEQCPRLLHLVLAEDEIEEGSMMKNYDNEYWVDPEDVPQCLSSHLRTFSLVNYEGHKGELLLAKYILKNARVLQSMTIGTAYNIKGKDTKVIQELSLCPRSSATCQISHEDYRSGYDRLLSNQLFLDPRLNISF